MWVKTWHWVVLFSFIAELPPVLITLVFLQLAARMSMNMQRSSLREEWGVTLQYTNKEGKLIISVKDVAEDSPASKMLKVGDCITTINDWKIEKITQPEVAANLFRAAGNFVSLDIDR